MKAYRILIHDRNYTSWEFCYADTNLPVTDNEVSALSTINPLSMKLFSRDIFTFDEKGVFIMVQPYTQLRESIAGVLLLENNKTFGRTANKKRLLYKCIPDDKRIPAFLIPYDIKLGFTKVNKNKFVTFKYTNWDDKHPHGILLETIGDVDNLNSFYEYQLYCRSLHISMTEFNNKTREKFKVKTTAEYFEQIFKNPDFQIEDRRDEYVFTVDPQNSCDYDDGYSIRLLEDGTWRVSIYIANVFFWLETLGLWNSFSKRVSTIYLPDRRRPMLPSILSDTLCSLQCNEDRFALVMDIIIDNEGNILNGNDIKYKNVRLRVNKNYVYEDPVMIAKDTNYINLLELTKKMDNTVETSHDVVAFWMVLMNTYTGSIMIEEKFGIFRTATYLKKPDSVYGLDAETTRVVQNWNNTTGQYILYNKDVLLEHELLNLKSYIHITSPIRRLVDLLNQMMLFEKFGLVKAFSKESSEFLNKWLNEMEYLNASMRSIRKIQTDCALVDKCFNNPEIVEKVYHGTVFDKIVKSDTTINYMVYLPELKLLSRISSSHIHMDNFTKGEFKIFLFEDEDKTKKKIRIQPVNETNMFPRIY